MYLCSLFMGHILKYMKIKVLLSKHQIRQGANVSVFPTGESPAAVLKSEGLGQLYPVKGTNRDLEASDGWCGPCFALLCFRWCCWRAVRATAAAPLALTHSSPSARCSNSPSRAPAPAAVRTRPSWRRWGSTAPVGDASQPPTDTSSPAAVRSAAKPPPAASGGLSTATVLLFLSNIPSYSRSLSERFHSCRRRTLWRLSSLKPTAQPTWLAALQLRLVWDVHASTWVRRSQQVIFDFPSRCSGQKSSSSSIFSTSHLRLL